MIQCYNCISGAHDYPSYNRRRAQHRHYMYVTLLSFTQQLLQLTYPDLGIPVCIWVTAEAPVVLLCICLPAMLPLGRHLASTYFSPLASKLSSLLSSRGGGNSSVRSKRGEFNSTTDTSSQGIRLRTAKPTASERGYNSIDSERGILPTKFQYTTRVHGGEQQGQKNSDIPRRSIQVERQFDINQLENQHCGIHYTACFACSKLRLL